MNKPEVIEHTTKDGHKVFLSGPEQLVTVQGIPCIKGRSVKRKGKWGKLMVRLDDKPELASQVETWKAETEEYNAWFAAQVEEAKSSMRRNAIRNFDTAENEWFSWAQWDGTSGNTLTEKATGREIYQMKYTGTGQRVEGDTRVRASAFWSALWSLQDPAPAYTGAEIKAAEEQQEKLERRNDHPGWCNHCHSYCYGDCQS